MAELSELGHPADAPSDSSGSDSWTSAQRDWARTRIEKKRKLRADFAAYVIINIFLVGTWAATGFGYFWPGWVLAGWGTLLLLDAWNLRYRGPVTDDDIDHELRDTS